jgi:branched-chain amino acid aminotransferase
MQSIKIELSKTRKPKPEMKDLPFGTYFTDHMFVMDYSGGQWHDPRIVPYAPFSIEPACMVLHYAQEIFEGMKAYRRPDGGIQLFRPYENFKRMNSSCSRMCIPQIDVSFAVEALKKLVSIEADWVPSEKDTSLYIRPFIFAADNHVGVHASSTYVFCIILCPVGSYYPEGLDPVKIMIEPEDVRAVKGGTGTVKCGGNYAASIRAGERAAEAGYSQVLWLDGIEHWYIEEVGSMNVMFKINGRVVTPMLQGSILPGITRKSCLELLRDWDLPVEERLISVDELLSAAEAGALEEAWGCGTAAVISPIGEIAYKDKRFAVGGGGIGEVARKLYETLTDIQWGRAEDMRGWTVRVI